MSIRYSRHAMKHSTSSYLPLATPVQFTNDWSKEPLPFEASASLSDMGSEIEFSFTATTKPQSHPQAKKGGFLAELWKFDVAEFFLQGSDAEYLEFNFSPNGAWWGAHFTSTRKLSSELPKASLLEIRTSTSTNRWAITARLCKKSIFEVSQIECAERGLLSAILSFKNRRYFLASDTETEGKADFHNSNFYKPLESKIIFMQQLVQKSS